MMKNDNTKLSNNQYQFFNKADSTLLDKRMNKLESDIKMYSRDVATDPSFLESIRAKRKLEKCKKELEELKLSKNIGNLPKDLRNIIKDYAM